MKQKRKKAVALSYQAEQDYAPKINATGKGLIAENIIKKAKEHQIPILEDQTLVELLSDLDVNEKIPEELFQVVAEVFAFIYQADKKVSKMNN